MPERYARTRVHRVVRRLCLGAFLVAMAVAMARYPGGDSFGGRAPGYSLTRNYFCDLTAPIAHDGASNPGRLWAQGAMCAFFVALLAFWWERRRAPTALDRWASRLGVGSALMALLIPFGRPRLGAFDLHGVLTLASGIPGLAAMCMVVASAFLRRRRAAAWLGAAALAACGATAMIYVHFLVTGTPPVALPLAQKIAAAILCAWLAHADRSRAST